MNIAINILIWAIGWFVMYGLIFLLYRDEIEEWHTSSRLSAVFWACFSWLGVALIIVFVLICLACMGGSWLAKKIVSPPLEKYEDLVEKLEAKVLKFFEKKTN